MSASNRISAKFKELSAKDEKALIPYIMAGDPSLSTTESLVLALEQAGADLIELGVPFSDPIADGPVIQKAAERSLHSGTSLRRILETVKNLRKKTQIPLILMAYYNTIMAMGEKNFCTEAMKVGIDGIIVPDMPPEESAKLSRATDSNGPYLIYLLAPTSTANRRKEVIGRSKGFIYYVSITGITGAKLEGLQEIQKNVEVLQKQSKKPVAVGFGIANPKDAKFISKFADGVIVGSALVKKIEEYLHDPKLVDHLKNLTRQFKKAIMFK